MIFSSKVQVAEEILSLCFEHVMISIILIFSKVICYLSIRLREDVPSIMLKVRVAAL